MQVERSKFIKAGHDPERRTPSSRHSLSCVTRTRDSLSPYAERHSPHFVPPRCGTSSRYSTRKMIYNPDLHNKSDATYQLWGNMVEFISIDQPQKVRGRKRDVLFINEANEINLEDWRQLLLRTTGRVLIDYNPSDEFHWIYEEVIPREDAEFFRTTYKDNPFLPQSVVLEIERFKTADENFWKVYGLGERGTSQSNHLHPLERNKPNPQ